MKFVEQLTQGRKTVTVLHEGRVLAPGFGDRFNNGSRGGIPATAVKKP